MTDKPPLTTAQRQTRCKECNGTGYAEPAPGFTFGNDCLVCKGDGWLNIPKPLTTAQRQAAWRQRRNAERKFMLETLEQIANGCMFPQEVAQVTLDLLPAFHHQDDPAPT